MNRTHEHHHEHEDHHHHEGHYGHHHHDEGHHGHHHHRDHHHGHHHGSQEYHSSSALRVKEGDVLTCSCGDCGVELTVKKSCTEAACGVDCEIDVRCCGEPMRLKGRES